MLKKQSVGSGATDVDQNNGPTPSSSSELGERDDIEEVLKAVQLPNLLYELMPLCDIPLIPMIKERRGQLRHSVI